MRNLKKFLALVLATMMLLSVAVISTSAADKADYTDAANHLAALQVMKGDENGNLMLENGVTRYQAALFFVQTLTGETDTAVWNADKKSANFSDVVDYGTAIDYANGIGIVKGRGNGVFGYNDAITYQDMLVMAVRALGYETEDMSYPYGYILAAQKLGLTDNVDLVNYKAALTRGETAQIIWDMLGTQVAVVDPLTDKVYYPEANQTEVDGKTGYFTENSLGKMMERVDLLVDSDLAGDKITVVVDAFVEGDEEEETVDTLEVTVVGSDAEITAIAAADLGITVDTPTIAYMGLPVELFISVNAEDFTDEAYEDGDATVVFATFPEYTTVQNLSADGDIKYVEDGDKSYLSLAGTKFKAADYTFETYEFVNGVWTMTNDGLLNDELNGTDVTSIFVYDEDDADKDGTPYNTTNTYGEVSYRVIESDEVGTVKLLYTDYEFGQYNVREIDGVKYTVVAEYDADAEYTNLDDVETTMVEYLVDRIGKSTGVVDVDTDSITPSKGEAASTVVVEGEAVEAGDFMFYNYNDADNILTVAMNAGKFQTGKLNGKNNKDNVKINGQFYEFGFAGNYDETEMTTAFDPTVYADCIAAMEAGKDNVLFLLVDGKIVHFEVYEAKDNTKNLYDYAIVTTDAELLSDLLDLDLDYVDEDEDNKKDENEDWDPDCEYMSALSESGLYVEDDVVKVAMLNLTTGKWELASVGTYATNYDSEKDKFNKTYDLATEIGYADLITDYKNEGVIADFADLVGCGLVAVVEAKDGVYTVAAEEEGFFEYNDVVSAGGLVFSDNNVKTNAITAIPAEDEPTAVRVALDAESVIVVITPDAVGVRVGTQKAANSVAVATVEVEGDDVPVASRFLSANADLIILQAEDVVFANEEHLTVADWADEARADSENAWYITTVDTTVEVQAGETDEDPYTITVLNLFDMKAQKVIESISYESKEATDEEYAVGTVLKVNAKGEVSDEGALTAEIVAEVAEATSDDLVFTAIENLEIVSDDTVIADGLVGGDAVDIKGTVVTINNVADAEDYDFSKVVLDMPYDEEIAATYKVDEAEVEYTGRSYDYVDRDETTQTKANKFLGLEYVLELDEVATFDKAAAGVIDNYIIDMADEAILVPVANKADYAKGISVDVDLYIAASYDGEESDVITIVIYKVINEVAPVVAD